MWPYLELSYDTHAGREQTTLSSLADRAWETDDDESLMLGTQITNKTQIHTHTSEACTYTHTFYLLSLTHPSFPIYSVVFFSVPSLILWWQRQMEGLRGEWLGNRGGEISLCLLVGSEITLIDAIGCCSSGLDFWIYPSLDFSVTSFMPLSLYFPSQPDIYRITFGRGVTEFFYVFCDSVKSWKTKYSKAFMFDVNDASRTVTVWSCTEGYRIIRLEMIQEDCILEKAGGVK